MLWSRAAPVVRFWYCEHRFRKDWKAQQNPKSLSSICARFRVHKLRRRNGCRLVQCTNTFPRRATSVLSGTVVKQEGGRHLLTSAAISSRFIQNPYQQVYFAYDCAMYLQVRPAKDAPKMSDPLKVSPKQCPLFYGVRNVRFSFLGCHLCNISLFRESKMSKYSFRVLEM